LISQLTIQSWGFGDEAERAGVRHGAYRLDPPEPCRLMLAIAV
jgi:hypothetical protein